jgi:hypothetical protein
MIGNMTRTIICIMLFYQILSGYSKGNFLFPEITFKDISLKEINKDSALKIIKGLKEYKRIFGLADIYDTVNHFYLSDIDNDKKNELIYYGLISAEGKWSIIWKFDHQNYQLFGELFGKITGISDSFYISTSGPGCCGSNYDYANLYRIMEDAIDFLRSAVIFNRVKISNPLFLRSAVISDGVKIPDSLPIKKNIVINNTLYSLRAQPILNDKPDSTDMERCGVLRGNTIVELGKGTVASATATYKDITGRVWWFLVLDNPPEAKYNVYTKEKRRICGWISAKDLDYKEIHQ